MLLIKCLWIGRLSRAPSQTSLSLEVENTSFFEAIRHPGVEGLALRKTLCSRKADKYDTVLEGIASPWLLLKKGNSSMYKERKIFSLKHVMSLGLMLLLLSTMQVFTTGVASAHTASPTPAAASRFCGSSCDGKNPHSQGCDASAEDEYQTNVTDQLVGVSGYIVIRYSTVCKAAWALISFNTTLPDYTYGNAIITRTTDNRQFDCTTGDAIVSPGQRSCYSGMVDDGAGTSAWAAAMDNYNGSPWSEFGRTSGAY